MATQDERSKPFLSGRQRVPGSVVGLLTLIGCLLFMGAPSEAQEPAELGGLVTASAGGPVSGVVVDYFAAGADGSRSSWLGAESTDAEGRFGRLVDPGCYVLVAIAPEGASFPGRGMWYQTPVCVESGKPVVVDIELTTTQTGGCVISGQVVATTVTGQECDALLAIFDATGGPGWSDNTGWATPTDPCTWFGITCESGHVAILNLRANNLVGELPPALGDLTGLRSLSIFENTSGPPGFQGDLRGVIPAELGRLTGLEWLELSNNRLVGSLPPELGELTNLQSISVRRNSMSGELPPSLGALAALENLQLDSNQFSGPIPAEYGDLVRLQYFAAQFNRLTGPIPEELGQLSDLQILSLQNNSLTGPIPAAIGQLPVRVFDAADNLLFGDMTDAMSGFRSLNPSVDLDLVGIGRTNCLSVSDPDLATWVTSKDSDWQQC